MSQNVEIFKFFCVNKLILTETFDIINCVFFFYKQECVWTKKKDLVFLCFKYNIT